LVLGDSTLFSWAGCHRFGHVEGPIRVKELGPPKSLLRSQSKTRTDYFHGQFGDLIFVSKESNEYQSWSKFRVIQPGHRICIIWYPDVGDMALARQGYKTKKSGRG
jgi:hypothetical protein